MSDRIALMFDGRLIQTGTPIQVYTHPACRQAADYFGNCVYIRGRVEDGIFKAPGISFAVQVSDGVYDIMLRPDCLEICDSGDYRLTVEQVSFRGSDTQVSFCGEDGTVWKKAYSAAVRWKQGDVLHGRLMAEEPVLFAL